MTTSTQSYYYGTGKRKTAIARVRLYPAGSGTILVNGKPLEEVMPLGRLAKARQHALRSDSGCRQPVQRRREDHRRRHLGVG